MELAVLDFEDYEKNEAAFRKGEQKGCYFRSDRFLVINGSYYFATREGQDIGPFATKAQARNGLERFIYAIQDGLGFERARALSFGSTWAVTKFR